MIMFYGDYPPYQPNVSQCSNTFIQGFFAGECLQGASPQVRFWFIHANVYHKPNYAWESSWGYFYGYNHGDNLDILWDVYNKHTSITIIKKTNNDNKTK